MSKALGTPYASLKGGYEKIEPQPERPERLNLDWRKFARLQGCYESFTVKLFFNGVTQIIPLRLQLPKHLFQGRRDVEKRRGAHLRKAEARMTGVADDETGNVTVAAVCLLTP